MPSAVEDADQLLTELWQHAARIDPRAALGRPLVATLTRLGEAQATAALQRCLERGLMRSVPRQGTDLIQLTADGIARAEQLEQSTRPRRERARAFREPLLHWVADLEEAGAAAVLDQHQVDGGHDGAGERLFGLAIDWVIVSTAYRDLAERGLLRVAEHPPGLCGDGGATVELTAAGSDFLCSGRTLEDFLTTHHPSGAGMSIENAAIFGGPVTGSAVAVGTHNSATANGNRVGAEVAQLVDLLRVLRPQLELDTQTAEDFDHRVAELERAGGEQPAAGLAWRAIRWMLPASLAAGSDPGAQAALEGAISLGTALFGG